MRCPSCSLPIDQPNLERCPQCGRLLAFPLEQSVSGAPPALSDGNPPPLGEADTVGGATPPQGPYGPFTPYGLPNPNPPASGYPPWGYPQTAPLLLPLPKRKRRTGLIVGIVALVVVVLAACTWGVVVTIQAIHPPALSTVPRETPYPIYDNSFVSSISPAGGWANDSHCFQQDDGFHVKGNYICFAPVGNESDVDIRVQAHQIAGPTNYPIGIAFRLLEKGSGINYYGFGITSSGYWGLLKCSEGKCDHLINFRRSSAVQAEIGAVNTLEVYAKGSHMDFFINGNAVGSIDDSSYMFGRIGLLCGDGAECAFTNLTIGELY